MCRNESRSRSIVRIVVSGLWALALCVVAGRADDPVRSDPADDHAQHVQAVRTSGSESATTTTADPLDVVVAGLRRAESGFVAWYRRTPPAERVTWAGMTACAALGVLVLLERLAGLRRRRIVPTDFTPRFLDRLHEGRLDCGQALDHCELNPSPAARVALAAVRRWGRPASDLERAVALAHRVESDRLRRNVGTLRRVAALAPLLGLLGSLFAVGRALEATTPAPATATATSPGASAPTPGTAVESLGKSGPLLASALTPLCTGIVIATLALVAYDGLLIRIEKLAGALDRLGAETIDAIAMATPVSTPISTFAPAQGRLAVARTDQPIVSQHTRARGPHQGYARVEDRRDPIPPAGQEVPGF
jgi:biopolymer transport protein ExbB